MKPNLVVTYTNCNQKHSANFCLNEKQMSLFEDSEYHAPKVAHLVLNRYANNTSSALHRRRINNIVNDRSNSDITYKKKLGL